VLHFILAFHDEIQAQIAQEIVHGLFHAFITFNGYEHLMVGELSVPSMRKTSIGVLRMSKILSWSMAPGVHSLGSVEKIGANVPPSENQG